MMQLVLVRKLCLNDFMQVLDHWVSGAIQCNNGFKALITTLDVVDVVQWHK